MSASAASITPPTYEDLAYMAAHMRDMDRLEFRLMSGGLPTMDCMHLLQERSSKMLVGRWHGEPVVLYGVTPTTLLSGRGQPWLAATSRVTERQIAKAFLRESRRALAGLSEGYDYLWNLVHAENAVAIRWLKWLGFTFTGLGAVVQGHRFEHFKMELEDVLSSTARPLRRYR